jgi:hypothetical protein
MASQYLVLDCMANLFRLFPNVPIQINDGPLVVNSVAAVPDGGVALKVPLAVHK